MTAKTAAQRKQEERARRKLGLIAVTVLGQTIAIPEDRVAEVLAMAVEPDD